MGNKDTEEGGIHLENYRIERDTIGEIKVPVGKYWGAQTQRSKQNFKIGSEIMPIEVIYAFAHIKKAAAKVNASLGNLNKNKSTAIMSACDEIINGNWDEHFPLVVWQTGSGTQTNMNVNEVIARRGMEIMEKQGVSENIHPNDDVNMAQSSNDTFPTAMHIAALQSVTQQLLPVLNELIATLQTKEDEFSGIIKIGRTHLQDATPLTLSQEVSGWRAMVEKDKKMIESTLVYLQDLAIGGTAVGTGINADKKFGELMAQEISKQTYLSFQSAPNKFQALTSHDELVHLHGALKALAADLMKIANDVRWLASGPRSGIGELTIPANEPGSSIMPGKVNPTQSEALTMIATQVFGNDATIGFAASQGNFELNVFKPVIIYNFLQSVKLLADGMKSFHDKCVVGIVANTETIKANLENSLMLVTALNPYIGYEKAAKIAKLAYNENLTLREAAIKTGFLTEEEYDKWVRPDNMI
ncbi:class II fumarate hydratase [Mesobacillus maritimus]|uniref:class II fumarate hydratase n=1 Tax=Mesobacillus maritimus TaxID=1643336 RepID=UPI002042092C|nr:class II fumarate hydratase [Mesobacillus maritimus]MCM3586035.1 class II fumarate hydratase [Mesobacillus maritimus]